MDGAAILNLMKKRRKHKGKDDKKYREIQENIQKEIIKVKDNDMIESCEESTDLENKITHSIFIRKLGKLQEQKERNKNRFTWSDKNGNIVLDQLEQICM